MCRWSAPGPAASPFGWTDVNTRQQSGLLPETNFICSLKEEWFPARPCWCSFNTRPRASATHVSIRKVRGRVGVACLIKATGFSHHLLTRSIHQTQGTTSGHEWVCFILIIIIYYWNKILGIKCSSVISHVWGEISPAFSMLGYIRCEICWRFLFTHAIKTDPLMT